MIRFVFSTLLCLAVVSVAAQKDSVRKYLDAELHFTTQNKAVYPAMAIKNGDHWILFIVNTDTTMLFKISFKDAALTIKDGPYTTYQGKEVILQTGFFKNNFPSGLWQSWYPNGQLKNSGTIKNNYLSGTWKYMYEDGTLRNESTYLDGDSLPAKRSVETYEGDYKQGILDNFSPQGIRQGLTSTWYKNGSKESEANYRNDSLFGLCIWYRGNGNLSSKETYANGKITDLECYNEEGAYTGASCSILKPPVFADPVYSALDYIENELHKQVRTFRYEGTAEVSFTVTKKGAVTDFVLIKSPDVLINDLLKKIITGMSPWSPAVVHNQVIDYSLKIEIPVSN
jgi:antitoxin component YwqK of YwqJK toxin-antitoxin module